MSSKNKKALLLCGLFIAVIAAGYANYLVTSGGLSGGGEEIVVNSGKQNEETEDVFAVFRQERQDTRAQEISYIDSVVTSAETDEETKAKAQEQKLAIVQNMETELTSEGLIQTKMGMDAVVTVKDGSVKVVVGKQELTDGEVAQIAVIVKAETGQPASNIKIMPKA